MPAYQLIVIGMLIGTVLTIAAIIIIPLKAAEPVSALDTCRLPVPNEKLIVTLNHADGKAICSYHSITAWGMAR